MSRLFIPNFTFEAESDAGWSAPTSLQRLNQELALVWLGVAELGDEILLAGVDDAVLPHADESPGVIWLADVRQSQASEIVPWGITPAVCSLARSLDVNSRWPDQMTIWEVNSRSYSVQLEHDLECRVAGTAVVKSLEELEAHLHTGSGWILKANLAQAGRGHIRCRNGLDEATRSRIARLLARDGMLIVEPLLTPVKELGVQWEIPKQGEPRLLAVTELLADTQGGYVGTRIGDLSISDSLLNEIVAAQTRAVQRIQERGYFGPLGIDAMIYRSGTQDRVRPLQDINARWTMGRIAWEWSRKLGGSETSLRGEWRLAAEAPHPRARALTPQIWNERPLRKRAWWIDEC